MFRIFYSLMYASHKIDATQRFLFSLCAFLDYLVYHHRYLASTWFTYGKAVS